MLSNEAARTRLEKDLTIRFLVGKIHTIHSRLENIVVLKTAGQRYNEVQKLLHDMSVLCEQLSMRFPHKNMTAYTRRRGIM